MTIQMIEWLLLGGALGVPLGYVVTAWRVSYYKGRAKALEDEVDSLRSVLDG